MPVCNDRERERDLFVRPRLGDVVREVDIGSNIGSNLGLASAMVVIYPRTLGGGDERILYLPSQPNIVESTRSKKRQK
jgi:hypothetical protein